jgi:hypothetical protein
VMSAEKNDGSEIGGTVEILKVRKNMFDGRCLNPSGGSL